MNAQTTSFDEDTILCWMCDKQKTKSHSQTAAKTYGENNRNCLCYLFCSFTHSLTHSNRTIACRFVRFVVITPNNFVLWQRWSLTFFQLTLYAGLWPTVDNKLSEGNDFCFATPREKNGIRINNHRSNWKNTLAENVCILPAINFNRN